MNRPDGRRFPAGPALEADIILNDLSTRQYLTPHVPLKDVLAAEERELGVCPRAAETALQWLGFDPATSIGRLRRSELSQLARSIERFWRQALASAHSSESQPA